MAFEQGAAYIFTGIDAGGVDTSSQNRRKIFDKFVNRVNDSRHAVDRKHPDGRFPDQFKIMILTGTDRGKEDFHAPACQSAY